MVQHLTDDSYKDVTFEEEEEEEEGEKHFPTAPIDDDVWWKNQSQTGTSASMNSHNHMICAHTSAHTDWISYTPLQNMHQHHNTCISATSSISPV